MTMTMMMTVPAPMFGIPQLTMLVTSVWSQRILQSQLANHSKLDTKPSKKPHTAHYTKLLAHWTLSCTHSILNGTHCSLNGTDNTYLMEHTAHYILKNKQQTVQTRSSALLTIAQRTSTIAHLTNARRTRTFDNCTKNKHIWQLHTPGKVNNGGQCKKSKLTTDDSFEHKLCSNYVQTKFKLCSNYVQTRNKLWTYVQQMTVLNTVQKELKGSPV